MLFWRARKEHRKLKKKATTRSPAHRAAVAVAKAQKWKWAQALLGASRLDLKGDPDRALKLVTESEDSIPEQYRGFACFVRGSAFQNKGQLPEAITAYREAVDDPKFESAGHAWFNLGSISRREGKLDEALKAYHKALDDPNYEEPGRIWNNIGNILGEKGEIEEAFKAYRKALEDPNYETPGYAWNNIGVAHSVKGERDEALKAYRTALKDPNYDTPGHAWNNIGNVYSAKGEPNEAIKAYLKAVDARYDDLAKVWVNLARAYVLVGKIKLAEEAFKKAIAAPDEEGSAHKRAQLELRLLKAKIAPSALSPDDRALTSKSAPSVPTVEIESTIIAAIEQAGDTQYDKYIGNPDSERDDTLSVLRGWSSAVTLLEGSERRWRGGGYFLKWRCCGVVIDPGFDFLRNFHDAGYHGREIRVVVVSHHHPDHNSDLKDIETLRYELYKRLADKKSSGSEPYVLLWDQDTSAEIKFGIETPVHHYEPIVLASGFPQPINLVKHEGKLPIRIIPFKVNHGSDVPHAMGLVVELLDKKDKPALRIGYTADTGYFEDLHKHLSGCDILIAHISQPSIEELQDASKLKEVHLGYRGTARLLKECKPRVALIGEFWAGFTDLRIALVKGLRQQSGVDALFPSGLAMHINLPSLEIECTECAKPTAFSQIKVAPPTDTFGSLAYLCPKCFLG